MEDTMLNRVKCQKQDYFSVHCTKKVIKLERGNEGKIPADTFLSNVKQG
jgi:hypothetical protein